ncbi:hypothetical protein BDQ17DRAFT_1245951 [Cyathus striatus]|nr:hypothetical protein BDQ17DRAFT_1245951 [Cyathus striatus]
MQLITGHISLNKYLHFIGKVASPHCTKGNSASPESVDHFLLRCPTYSDRRKPLLIQCTKRDRDISLHKILKDPENLTALADFVNATGHLKQTLGVVPCWSPTRDGED